MDHFVYNPAAIPDYVHAVAQSSAQLEDVRTQAQTALASVREEFEGSGGMSFEQAQMMINSGIDAGKEVILRHPSVVDNALQRHGRMTDAAAPSRSGCLDSPEATDAWPGRGRPRGWPPLKHVGGEGG